MREPIRLIRDMEELEGTNYFEFLPGEYRGQSWNVGSVFLEEEVFGLIEPIFIRRVTAYDHYDFMRIDRPTWQRIVGDLRGIGSAAGSADSLDDLRGLVGFFFTTSEERFAGDFVRNAEALSQMSSELASWLTDRLRDHECVSLLGM